MEKILIGRTNELEKIPLKRFNVRGRDIVVARVGDKYHAMSNVCTHEHSLFSEEGELHETTITCTRHGATFDLQTGAVKALPAVVPLKIYPIEILGEEMFIIWEE